MNPLFKRVGSVRPGRSVFDLSYEKKFTADMGYLYPIMCDEVVPGDTWEIGNEIVIRFQPLIAPMLHEVNCFVHYFFVPYRLLDENWEDFITGGVDGASEAVLPRWTPVSTAVGSLWDYFGFPTGVTPVGALPIQYPLNAYNLVYNEYYRDETQIDEVSLTSEVIQKRAWEKDYLTSALPWQQRGTAPALPISGTSHAVWPDSSFYNNGSGVAVGIYNLASDHRFYMSMGAYGLENIKGALNSNTVDLSEASTFDVADLRLAFQIQKWMERNARAGVRYVEFIGGHFGEQPRDDRLQRPEYLGGSKNPVIISEVLQTSSTDATSAQGNLAGHGITVGQTFAAKYHALEYGCIIGIMSVMPKPAYQQGIDRQWLRRTRYDFYFPEFANLSEQAIELAEVYAQGTEALNRKVFGYQGRYDEMRVKRNQVCGLMRTVFDYWHMGRKFTAEPALNQAFIECDATKRVFAVPSEPGLVVSFGNRIRAIRPLPIMSEPGLIDHN